MLKRNNTQNLVVFIHRLYFDGKVKKGGLDQILDYFVEQGFTLYLAEFPLDYSQQRIMRFSKFSQKGVEVLEERVSTFKISIFNWILETAICFYWSLKYKLAGSVVAASDPLMAFPATLLRYTGFFKYLYYHSVDYSPNRFNNKFLNFVYMTLMFFGMENSDLVGAVTKRMVEKLSEFDVGKIMYIPNSPDYDKLQKYFVNPSFREKSLVITCSEISEKYEIQRVLEIFNKLSKQISEINLNLIGYINKESVYYEELLDYAIQNNLKDKIVFHGHLSREDNLSVLGKSKVGIAFYNEIDFSHVSFGDSLKIREYSALGIPTIADSSTSTAVEMAEHKAGYVVSDDHEAVERIKLLFEDEKLYELMSDNASKWARSTDKIRLINSVYTQIISVYNKKT